MRAAELCPTGYRTLDDDEKLTGIDINASRVSARTRTDLTIVCGTAPVAESPAPAMTPAAGTTPPPSSAPAPTGAAGFVFGASPSEAQAVCEAAGYKWQPHPAAPSCSGIRGNAGYKGSSRVGICPSGKLCWVALQIADSTSDTRAELARTLSQKYLVQERSDAQGTTWWQWPDSRYVALEAVRTDNSQLTLWYADQDGARILTAQGL